MDWIDGYEIRGNALHSPSGEKIAAITRAYDDIYTVLPLSPEIRDVDLAGTSSAEAACQRLVVAHAKHLRVVPADDVREVVMVLARDVVQARNVVQVSGDHNTVTVEQDIMRRVQDAPPSRLISFLKEDLPKALGTSSSLATLVAALSGL